jgi:methionyl aminopeptidase
MSFPLYTKEDFANMRKAGRLASDVLDMITPHVKAGVSTNTLNDLCYDFIVKNGARPSPLGYKGYPKSVCTSVNHVVCHGIPSDKVLKEGDIINIDVTVDLNGYHGDTSRTFSVGKVSLAAQKLVDTTRESLERAIAIVGPGTTLGDIGSTIQLFVESKGYSVVEDFCGHGIGKSMHHEPQILHYGIPGTGYALEPGFCFTIEPMINAGKKETKVLADGWTAVTRDKSLSAQFEHTIGVTDDGCEVFTRING